MDWLESVYRIDQNPISDFSSDLKTYYRSPDWSSSGSFSNQENIPKDWLKEVGLFGGKLKNIIPYATPRNVRWIVTKDLSRPTVIFAEKDKQAITSYRPYLSKFSQSSFTQQSNGEFFSHDPKQAMKQEMIRNPLRFMQKWYNVKFVPNLDDYAKQLKSQDINFDSEGL